MRTTTTGKFFSGGVCLPVELVKGQATCQVVHECSHSTNAVYETQMLPLRGHTSDYSTTAPLLQHASINAGTCRCTDGYSTAAPVPVDGTLVCTPCPAGTWGLNGLCHPCLPGTANTATGREACLPCAAGEYQDSEGKSSCMPCPAGHYCQAGATTPEPCQLDYVQPDTGKPSCVPCGHNQYSNDKVGQTECLTCGGCGVFYSAGVTSGGVRYGAGCVAAPVSGRPGGKCWSRV
jgi:hypothetical protein